MSNNSLKKNKAVSKPVSASVVGIIDDKTIKVIVTRSVFVTIPGKIISRSKAFLCSYSDQTLKIGDSVNISQCKPVSKKKRFCVVG